MRLSHGHKELQTAPKCSFSYLSWARLDEMSRMNPAGPAHRLPWMEGKAQCKQDSVMALVPMCLECSLACATPILPLSSWLLEKLALQMPPGPFGISMDTPRTPGRLEPLLSAAELMLPYPPFPLLSGPSLARDVPTPEDEPLLLLPDRPLPCCGPPVSPIPPLPELSLESEEFSEPEPSFSPMSCCSSDLYPYQCMIQQQRSDTITYCICGTLPLGCTGHPHTPSADSMHPPRHPIVPPLLFHQHR